MLPPQLARAAGPPVPPRQEQVIGQDTPRSRAGVRVSPGGRYLCPSSGRDLDPVPAPSPRKSAARLRHPRGLVFVRPVRHCRRRRSAVRPPLKRPDACRRDHGLRPEADRRTTTYDETKSSAPHLCITTRRTKIQHTSCTPLELQDHQRRMDKGTSPRGDVRCPRDHDAAAPRNRADNERQDDIEHARRPANGCRAFPAGNARGGRRGGRRGGTDRPRVGAPAARYGREQARRSGHLIASR